MNIQVYMDNSQHGKETAALVLMSRLFYGALFQSFYEEMAGSTLWLDVCNVEDSYFGLFRRPNQKLFPHD
jgi:hypothetical protein